jgi:transposase-like protein
MNKQLEQNVKRTQRDYSLGFKLTVVSEVERGLLSYKEAQVKYGIQGRSTVLVWLRKHGNLDWSPQYTKLMPSKETPAQEIKRLKRELRDAQDKNLLLDEMVTIIDTEYGGNIRKKYLAPALADYNRKKGLT